MISILPAPIDAVVKAIKAAGGDPYVVGGAVRDCLLGCENTAKDFDFEVFNLGADELSAALSSFGRVETVGSSFGVIKLWMNGAPELDFALPRRESKTGRGHRGFMVLPDPRMTREEACARRDFTVNAMLMDPVSGEIFDYFNGRRDLEARVLRHTSDHFGEDPLRPLRAVQLAGRFGFTVHEETALRCHAMTAEASSLAHERIYAEWEKWALKSTRPSVGLCALRIIGWVCVFPELEALIGLDQDPAYHPECDAWTHTLAVVDAAAGIAARERLGNADRLTLVFSALCHDLGKADTTEMSVSGRITAKAHASRGEAPAAALLKRMGVPIAITRRVLPLVREHMFAVGGSPLSERAVRRLADRLKPETIAMLVRVIEADRGSREPLETGTWRALESLAKALGTHTAPPEPLLRGRELLSMGFPPGPKMGKMLQNAFEAQLDGAFTTREEAVAWAEANWIFK